MKAPDALPRLVIVDHHDSYTRNLLSLLSSCFDPAPDPELLASRVAIIPYTHPSLHPECFVHDLLPHVDGLILSPGPGTSENDNDFGPSMALLNDPALQHLPIFGVCLGHQGLATSAGASISQLKEPFHGRKRELIIESDAMNGLQKRALLNGVKDGTEVICYNSLVVDPDSVPDTLLITAKSYLDNSSQFIVQALEHRTLPRYGVQFHPESIESSGGQAILSNFIAIVRDTWAAIDPKRIEAWKTTSICLPDSIREYGNECVALGAKVHSKASRWKVLSKSMEYLPVSLEDTLRHHMPAIVQCLFRSPGVGCVWLDSASPRDPQSKLSILSHADFILTYDMEGELHLSNQNMSESPIPVDMGNHDSLWSWLDTCQRTMQAQTGGLDKSDTPLFRSGFMGFWSYEMKDESLGLARLSSERYEFHSGSSFDRTKLPAAQWGFCSRALCYDHSSQSWIAYCLVDEGGETSGPVDTLCSIGARLGVRQEEADVWFKQVQDVLLNVPQVNPRLPSPPNFLLDALDGAESYKDKIEQARKLIAAGESYEICLTTQFEGTCDDMKTYDDYFLTYCSLRRKNPAPFGAYLEMLPVSGVPQAILSTSPERFLTLTSTGQLEMRPIKGTKVRPGWGAGEEDWLQLAHTSKEMAFRVKAEDESRRQSLLADPKERAENLMIADLIRADMQSVCYPGSVKVPRLIALETYETVHQLVTSVTGLLRPGIGCVDATKRCFPPGSMTGAPKFRSVELIETLERSGLGLQQSRRRRGVYSGALGFIGIDGATNLSVVIRTVIIQGNKVYVGAGGAITFLSSPDGEWNEVLTKLGSVGSLAH